MSFAFTNFKKSIWEPKFEIDFYGYGYYVYVYHITSFKGFVNKINASICWNIFFKALPSFTKDFWCWWLKEGKDYKKIKTKYIILRMSWARCCHWQIHNLFLMCVLGMNFICRTSQSHHKGSRRTLLYFDNKRSAIVREFNCKFVWKHPVSVLKTSKNDELGIFPKT